MTNNIEAMKQWLEALEGLKSLYGGNGYKLHEINTIHRNHDAAITSLRQAIAEAERQEPLTGGDYRKHIICLCPDCVKTPQRQPQIWEHEGYEALCQELELWKAQAQRQPLTEKEIRTQFCGEKENFWDFNAGVRYAEAAHGIKGEA